MRTDAARPPARKRFGQHFLEAVWADKVVAAIDPQPHEVFLEIGPGPGAITRRLAEKCAALVACEIDRDLATALRNEHLPRVHILEGDFLTMSVDRLREALTADTDASVPCVSAVLDGSAAPAMAAAPRASASPAASALAAGPGATAAPLSFPSPPPPAPSYRVAGNLPYNVASPIMFRLIELARQGLPIVDATIMLQREVADRLLAVPGTREYGLLSVLIGHRASIARRLNLPPGAFRPAPKVHSTVVTLTFHAPDPPVANESVLAGMTAAVFSQRRKTLGNALQAYAITPRLASTLLAESGVDSRRRPETLSVSELCRIANNFTVLQS